MRGNVTQLPRCLVLSRYRTGGDYYGKSVGRASWRAKAAAIAWGCCSHMRVLPSISVKRKVTVSSGSVGMQRLLDGNRAQMRS